MNILCVDDEPLVLGLTVSLCRELPDVTDVTGVSSGEEAVAWAKTHTPDICLLDIDMPDIGGLKLAELLRQKHPGVGIIFLTGYSEYAVDAFALHADGYLLKPVNRAKLAQEVAFAASRLAARPRIRVQTFGNFAVFADGKPVAFARSKARELLAYLVDREGGGVTRAEAFAALWEDENYDRSMQKQLDVIIRSLRQSLDDAGIGKICEMSRGTMRVVPEEFECDLYAFIKSGGKGPAADAFRGEYMSSYSWASLTEGWLDRMKQSAGR